MSGISYGNVIPANNNRPNAKNPSWPRFNNFAVFQPTVYANGIQNYRRERSMAPPIMNQVGIAMNTGGMEVSCLGMEIQKLRTQAPGQFSQGFNSQPLVARPRSWKDKGTFNLYDRTYLTADLKQKTDFRVGTSTY